MDSDRSKHWTLHDEQGHNGDYTFVVREGEDEICRVKRRADADQICDHRTGLLREAGLRAAELRRYDVNERQLRADIQVVLKALAEVAQVLKFTRPRDVLRSREEIRRLLIRMHGRGYSK